MTNDVPRRWIGRSARARLVNTINALALPVVGILYVGVAAVVHHEFSLAAGLAVGGPVALLCAAVAWFRRCASVCWLRGRTLRVLGRGGGTIDLAEVEHAVVHRRYRSRTRPHEYLVLRLEDGEHNLVELKLGDGWAASELSPDGLLAIADQLRHSPSDAAHRAAGWLVRFAEDPTSRTWPTSG